MRPIPTAFLAVALMATAANARADVPRPPADLIAALQSASFFRYLAPLPEPLAQAALRDLDAGISLLTLQPYHRSRRSGPFELVLPNFETDVAWLERELVARVEHVLGTTVRISNIELGFGLFGGKSHRDTVEPSRHASFVVPLGLHATGVRYHLPYVGIVTARRGSIHGAGDESQAIGIEHSHGSGPRIRGFIALTAPGLRDYHDRIGRGRGAYRIGR